MKHADGSILLQELLLNSNVKAGQSWLEDDGANSRAI